MPKKKRKESTRGKKKENSKIEVNARDIMEKAQRAKGKESQVKC